jgi:hypothetical protein
VKFKIVSFKMIRLCFAGRLAIGRFPTLHSVQHFSAAAGSTDTAFSEGPEADDIVEVPKEMEGFKWKPGFEEAADVRSVESCLDVSLCVCARALLWWGGFGISCFPRKTVRHQPPLTPLPLLRSHCLLLGPPYPTSVADLR